MSNTDKYYPSLGICGHENTTNAFLNFLCFSGIKNENKPVKSKKSSHLWRCDIHSKKTIKALDLLYDNATVYLERKYEKYLKIKNQQYDNSRTKSNYKEENTESSTLSKS